jgi:hypothetical protein
MNKLSRNEIINRLKTLTSEERRIGVEILHCLREVESRMIYAELGYPSLYDFCVTHLHYSEGSAFRRISAMRVLKNIPDAPLRVVETKISEGVISITNLSLIHSFLKTEKKQERKEYTPEEKLALISTIENQSKRKTEKLLAAIQPKMVPVESQKVITQNLTEIKFIADDHLISKLTRIKEITSHINPNPTHAELFHRMADEYLKRSDPLLKARIAQVKKESFKSKSH